jgi:putative membrane protein
MMIGMLKNFGKGLAFGVTQIVPGVSGGTVAIIMGFYGELIDTINNFRKNYRKSFAFAVPFAVGIGFGIILFSTLIGVLLEMFSLPTMFFFIGLISGIAPIIFDKIKPKGGKVKVSEVILIIVPIILLVAVSHIFGEPEPTVRDVTPMYMLYLFIAGALAAAGLLIPGVSGSFILILMGVYYVAIDALRDIGVLLGDVTNVGLILSILKILMPIGFGVIAGGLLTARLIGGLLEHYRSIVYSVILGLIIGSVYVLVRRPEVYASGLSVPLGVTAAVTFAAGWVISYKLGREKM